MAVPGAGRGLGDAWLLEPPWTRKRSEMEAQKKLGIGGRCTTRPTLT